MNTSIKNIIKLLLLLIIFNIQSAALANFHLWDLSEIYSDESGDVLYIELFCAVNGQQFLNAHDLIATSDGNAVTFTFPGDSGSPTQDKFLLLATSNFASIPGAVTPDFILPDQFFDRTATNLQLNFGPGQDIINITGADIPFDGLSSLNLLPATPTQTTNSPTNFAGNIGDIFVPPNTLFKNGFED
jgi:hypothetical protein